MWRGAIIKSRTTILALAVELMPTLPREDFFRSSPAMQTFIQKEICSQLNFEALFCTLTGMYGMAQNFRGKKFSQID